MAEVVPIEIVTENAEEFVARISDLQSQPVWWHYLTITIPHKIDTDSAFFVIRGGNNLKRYVPCADPGFFFRGGGGVRKQSGRVLLFFFLSSTYFTVYRGVPMVLLQRKLLLFLGSRGGSNIFQGGGQLFPRGGGGPNANFYRNPYNL